MRKTVYDYEATVIDVVDGDTLECEMDMGFYIRVRMKIRLQGIDTPELRSKNVQEGKIASEAREYLMSRLLGKKVRIFTYSKDSFGRWLGTIFTLDDSTNINREMVEKGYAKEYMMPKDFDIFWSDIKQLAEEKLRQSWRD